MSEAANVAARMMLATRPINTVMIGARYDKFVAEVIAESGVEVARDIANLMSRNAGLTGPSRPTLSSV